MKTYREPGIETQRDSMFDAVQDATPIHVMTDW
jgi:hypothetical protein